MHNTSLKFTLLNISLLTAFLTTSADADTFNCGDTINTGGTVSLTADVGPCDDNVEPALTVVAPTVLNLNGYRVFCEDTNGNGVVPNGILMTGNGGKIKDGTVEGCVDNIQLGNDDSGASEGSHIVVGVVSKNTGFDAEGDGGDCFDIATANNKLKDSTAKNCSDDGIDIDGDNNVVKDNVVDGIGDNCLAANGASNRIKENEIVGCTDRGIDLDGNSNIVIDNEVSQTGKEGIRADDGSFNIIKENEVSEGAEEGIKIESQGNIVRSNESEDNAGAGILVKEGGGTNIIKANEAEDNLVDLVDENADCGTNVWSNNDFDTADPSSCIS